MISQQHGLQPNETVLLEGLYSPQSSSTGPVSPRLNCQALESLSLYMFSCVAYQSSNEPVAISSQNHVMTLAYDITFHLHNHPMENQVLACHWLVLGTLSNSSGQVVSHGWSHG